MPREKPDIGAFIIRTSPWDILCCASTQRSSEKEADGMALLIVQASVSNPQPSTDEYGGLNSLEEGCGARGTSTL